jgi:hypothetical protein
MNPITLIGRVLDYTLTASLHPDFRNILRAVRLGAGIAGGEAVSSEAARAIHSSRNSAAYTAYREHQWQKRSKHTETES